MIEEWKPHKHNNVLIQSLIYPTNSRPNVLICKPYLAILTLFNLYLALIGLICISDCDWA